MPLADSALQEGLTVFAEDGGDGGIAFDAWNDSRFTGIQSVQAVTGTVLDRLTITFTSGDKVSPGGDGGGEHPEYAIAPNRIIEIKQCFGNCANVAGRCISGLQIKTDDGRQSPMWGTSGDHCSTYEVPDNKEVVSVFGRSGTEVDHLGWYLADACSSAIDDLPKGRWVPIASSVGSKQQLITETVGTTHSGTVTNTKTWSSTATAKISAGFSFAGISFGADISESYTDTLAQSMSSTLSKTKMETYSAYFPPGQVWQWVMEFTGTCGQSLSKSNNFVVTNSIVAPPCCPMGGFKDASDPSAGCLDELKVTCT